MNYIAKTRKLVSMLMGILMFGCSVLAIMHFSTSIKISMINSNSSYASKTVVVFDRITKGLMSFNEEKSPLNSKAPEKKKSKYSGLLLYIISTILITNEKRLLLVLIVSFLSLFIKNGKKRTVKGNDRGILSKLKFYLWWRLKFLTPLQKCICERSDEYDINPMNIGIREKYVQKRTAFCFFIKQSAVFLCISQGR
jgi:hypothetical protein